MKDHFRRDVARSSHNLLALLQNQPFEDRGPEVDDLYVAIGVEHQIRKFDVSVHYSALVNVMESLADLKNPFVKLLVIARNASLQGASLKHLHLNAEDSVL